MFSRQPKCSFCLRSQADVAKLVSGGRVYICDECVTQAHRIINAPDDDVRPPVAWPRPTASQMVTKLLRALRRRLWRSASWAWRSRSAAASGVALRIPDVPHEAWIPARSRGRARVRRRQRATVLAT